MQTLYQTHVRLLSTTPQNQADCKQGQEMDKSAQSEMIQLWKKYQVLLTLKGDPVLVLDGRAEDGAGITNLGFAGVTLECFIDQKPFQCLD